MDKGVRPLWAQVIPRTHCEPVKLSNGLCTKQKSFPHSLLEVDPLPVQKALHKMISILHKMMITMMMMTISNTPNLTNKESPKLVHKKKEEKKKRPSHNSDFKEYH